MTEDDVLQVEVTFPHGIYSGASRGTPEPYPTGTRLHDALTAAAGSGPDAEVEDGVLVANDAQRAALEYLEETELRGVVVPRHAQSQTGAQRFRWRASPVTLDQTPFEPRSAVAGPVTFVWDAPESDQVVDVLAAIAAEVESVGRADSLALVRVFVGPLDTDGRRVLYPAQGRGPGLVMSVPRPGRHAALVRRHRDLRTVGKHVKGSLGKQAADEQPAQSEEAVELRRFADRAVETSWPSAETWVCKLDGPAAALSSALRRETSHVALAVAWHRAIVRDLGSDVPAFVTGRDGDGPLRGTGHMALHFAQLGDGQYRAIVALPHGIDPADSARLWAVLQRGVAVHWGRGRRALRFTVHAAETRSASDFWEQTSSQLTTAIPLLLDVPGGPRKGPWSLEDSVTHTIGNAFRGTLEQAGVEWGTGWAFRRHVVDVLTNDFGVEVQAAQRVREGASRFVHRAAPHDLLVALHVDVSLGTLQAPDSNGFVALGRARHLGGGLLIPYRSAR